MSMTVCLCANSLRYPEGGGHQWVYLNWALGLRAIGCRVIWLEWIAKGIPAHQWKSWVAALKARLGRYGLAESVALYSWENGSPSVAEADGCLDLDEAAEADLLLNLAYNGIPAEVVGRFRRSALVDIDPGLTQIWMSTGLMIVPRHDHYFTIGETVGRPGSIFPDCGLRWHYTAPPVYLPAWPMTRANSGEPFTTVTNWWGGWIEFQGQTYDNGKRSGFMPFLDLPRRTDQPLELAVCLGREESEERVMLQEWGWRIRDPNEVVPTPWHYQRYIRESRGEFSCAKPSCLRLQNAWISDRTLCYLASGKPAVVQHTGPSRFLPDSAGLFRFRDIGEAVRSLERVGADYDRQCSLARSLAEEWFDAEKVVGRLLERALK